jgi:hypothetical protein
MDAVLVAAVVAAAALTILYSNGLERLLAPRESGRPS